MNDEPKARRGKPGEEPKKPKIGLPLILLLVLMVAIVGQFLQEQQYPAKPISEIMTMAAEGKVEKAVITPDQIKVVLRAEKGEDGKDKEPARWSAQINGDKAKERFQAAVEDATPRGSVTFDNSGGLFGPFFFMWILPIVLVAGLFWFLMRRMGPPQGVMNFGKSKAKIYAEKEVHVTFADVAGADEAVEEVKEIVEFLREPKKFQALGARIPKGVLLLGAPGTGKTLLARAIAGEAGVPFFSLSGSDFVEMFVGVGASRVRDLFRQAEQQSPCIVFIDELDALGKTRGSSPISNDEREQTLNALLVEMDGFDANSGVIIISATNRPEILDPALLRPGRFDRQIVVDRPDVFGRRKILDVHARKVKLDPTVDLSTIAKRTPGFVGADLANVVNEAALLAARKNQKSVMSADLEEAIDRVMTGLKKQRRGITAREKEIVATHETGHALVGYFTPGTDPVHRISVIPRGVSTGGSTMFLPEEERMVYTRDELVARIMALLGGRAAERVVYGHLSTGASNDLEVASRIARHMVTRYGMSERVGPVSLEDEGAQFLRDSMVKPDRAHSESTQNVIDEEVREIVSRCEVRAVDLVTRNRELLERVRGVLMEKEVVEREEFERLMTLPVAPAA
ncbi:MAG: ATP-dependent zinc metalloprotease FtsH [Planctomycetes bacterium]|nr:ATP-dependent zinc metalloprotease FtsH [Planctomycetota bacterium]